MATFTWRDTKTGRRCEVKVRVRSPSGRVIQRKKSFRRKTDAKTWAAATEAKIRGGRLDDATGARRLRLLDLIESYNRHQLTKLSSPKSIRERARQLAWWRERVGDVFADALVPSVILGHLDDLRSGRGARPGRPVSLQTRNRYLAALGSVYRLAVKQGQLRKSEVPTAGLYESEVGTERDRWLSEDEHRRLLAEIRGKPLEIWVLLGMSTGARAGELTKLRWRHVDLRSGTIELTKTKNHTSRVVPILPRALEILRERARLRRTLQPLRAWPTPRRRSPRHARPGSRDRRGRGAGCPDGGASARSRGECLWRVAYENSNPVLGDADAVADHAGWYGDAAELCDMLSAAPLGFEHGFLEEDGAGVLRIHDLEAKASDYVRKRRRREDERRRRHWRGVQEGSSDEKSADDGPRDGDSGGGQWPVSDRSVSSH